MTSTLMDFPRDDEFSARVQQVFAMPKPSRNQKLSVPGDKKSNASIIARILKRL